MPGHISSTICLPVDIYEGGGGDLVLCQEFPSIKGEHYVRIFIDMDQAEHICATIMEIARAARSK